jgi:hypothetical protein
MADCDADLQQQHLIHELTTYTPSDDDSIRPPPDAKPNTPPIQNEITYRVCYSLWGCAWQLAIISIIPQLPLIR